MNPWIMGFRIKNNNILIVDSYSFLLLMILIHCHSIDMIAGVDSEHQVGLTVARLLGPFVFNADSFDHCECERRQSLSYAKSQNRSISS